jgi:hypothetical protein
MTGFDMDQSWFRMIIRASHEKIKSSEPPSPPNTGSILKNQLPSIRLFK